MPFTKLGQKQYGTQDWLEFSAYGFQGGINIKAAPQDLDDGDLTSAVNVYLRSDGGIEQRKGYSSVNGPLTLNSTGLTNGNNGSVRFVQRLIKGVAQNPSKKWLLQQYNIQNLVDSTTATQPAGVPANLFSAPTQNWTTAGVLDPNGGSAKTGGAAAYGVSDTLIIAGDPTGPWYWNGSDAPYQVGGSGGVGASGAALGATLVQVVNNIVFFAGMPSSPNTVIATSLYVAAVAGTGPEYYYQQFTMSYPVTCLGIIGSGAQAGLVVGTQKTLTLIYGTFPGNYNVQDIPVNDGPISPRCNLSIYGQFYYLGRQAFYRFDGQSAPQRLSDKIEPWVLGDTNATNPSFAMLGDRTKYWAFYYNNRIHIVYDSVGLGVLSTMLAYDLVNNGWTIESLPNGVISFSALDGPGDPAPTTGVIFYQNAGNQWFWDQYSTGTNTADEYNGSTGQNINAYFTTKYFKTGVPGTPKRLMRWYPEFFTGPATFSLAVINDYGASQAGGTAQGVGNASYYGNAGSQTLNGGTGYGYALWASGVRGFLGAPTTRQDANLTGEAFAFSAGTNAQTQPWVFQGLTGNYAQEAKV
jgi:hypothetical protein